MWTTNFYRSFSKNMLLYMSSRLSKIRSVHTYAMPRTVYFGSICIQFSNFFSKTLFIEQQPSDIRSFHIILFAVTVLYLHFWIADTLVRRNHKKHIEHMCIELQFLTNKPWKGNLKQFLKNWFVFMLIFIFSFSKFLYLWFKVVEWHCVSLY